MSSAILADGRQLDAQMHLTLFNGQVVYAPTERTKRYVAEALLQLLSSEPIRIAGEPTPIFHQDEPHRIIVHVHARDTKMYEKLFTVRSELLFRLQRSRCSRALPNPFHLSIDGAYLRHIFHDFGL